MQKLSVRSRANFGKTPATFLEFLREYDKARSEGWQLPEQVSVGSFPLFLNEFHIVLEKSDVVEVEPVQLTDEEREAAIKKSILNAEKLSKDEMQWFAERNSIVIPEEVSKFPLQMRKYLKEQIQK